jgi:hypothetical protein
MRAATREPMTARNYFLVGFGLNEMPSRIAIFTIVLGGRPISFAMSSNGFEAFANSISRRCSLNVKPVFRTIMECVLLCAQSRQAESLDDFSVWVRAGNSSGPPSIFDLRAFATNAAR